MQAWWGNYPFPVNAAEVTNVTTAEVSPQGLPLRYTSAYDITATLIGSGQIDLSNREAALRNALAIPKQDFILRTDNGRVSSSSIISKLTMSGTRVRNLKFSQSQGAEYVNRRTVQFTIDAVYLIANAANAMIFWKETVKIVGNGGPLRKWRFPVNFPIGIRQELSKASLVIAIQSGNAVGHTGKPHTPLPLFPNYLVNEAVEKGNDSPEFIGQGYINYPVSWSYRFERGDGPLIGLASLPPGVI